MAVIKTNGRPKMPEKGQEVHYAGDNLNPAGVYTVVTVRTDGQNAAALQNGSSAMLRNAAGEVLWVPWEELRPPSKKPAQPPDLSGMAISAIGSKGRHALGGRGRGRSRRLGR